MKNFRFFSGTSNLPLAEKIAKELGVSLGEREIIRFPDGECRVFIKEDLTGKDAFILQSLSRVADCNLMELCLLGSAAKRFGARKIIAIIPWLGYSKQDKEFRRGEAVSIQLVAKFLEATGFDGIITCELHSQKIPEYFSIPLTQVSTKQLLARQVKKSLKLVIVSPDKGGRSRAEDFAEDLVLPIVHLEKERDRKTGKVKVLGIDKNISGKEAVIFDDMINTGSTAIETAKFLTDKGAKKILFLATHGVLSVDAPKKLQISYINKVVVTDTISIPKEKRFPKLSIISTAGLLAKAIQSLL